MQGQFLVVFMPDFDSNKPARIVGPFASQNEADDYLARFMQGGFVSSVMAPFANVAWTNCFKCKRIAQQHPDNVCSEYRGHANNF